jgi:uncharacterized membrane protein YhhN
MSDALNLSDDLSHLRPILPLIFSYFTLKIYHSSKYQPMLKPLEYLYMLVALIEIYAEATHNELVRFFSKPLLMVLLLAFYVQSIDRNWNKLHKFMAASFVFAWMGDVALMFVPKSFDDTSIMGLPKNPNFFLVGLAAFLVAHMLYAIAFGQVSNKSKAPLLPRKFWVAIPLAIYMVTLLYYLAPAINDNVLTKPFLGPVIIYSMAIATMVAFALNRYGRVNDRSFALIFGGALLFMFSDSIIAVNKFLYPFESSGIFIMVLYIAGQYFIAKGALQQSKRDR